MKNQEFRKIVLFVGAATLTALLCQFRICFTFLAEASSRNEETQELTSTQLSEKQQLDAQMFQFMKQSKKQAYQDYLDSQVILDTAKKDASLKELAAIQKQQKAETRKAIKMKEEELQQERDLANHGELKQTILDLKTKLHDLSAQTAEVANRMEQEAKARKAEEQRVLQAKKVWVAKNCRMKSFMGYRKITNRDSAQYKFQQREDVVTGEHGIRMQNGRYCIAVGSAFTTKIGTKIDVVLAGGKTIPCVLADCKADQHTDATHTYCTGDNSAIEFVVSEEHVPDKAKGKYCYDGIEAFSGVVDYMLVYVKE